MVMLLKLKVLLRAFGRNGLVLLYALRDSRTPSWVRLLSLLMVLYVLSPIDIISDLLPIIGWADDFAVLTFGVPWLLSKIPQAVKLQAQQQVAARSWARWFGG
jgi:uncharacterized membrane protein YkvA (DUF1232 family)